MFPYMCSKVVAMLNFCIFVPILQRRGRLFAWLPWLTIGLQGKMMSCSSRKSESMSEKEKSFPRRFPLQGPVKLPPPLPPPPSFLPLERTFRAFERRVDIALKKSVPLTRFHIPVVYLRFVSQGLLMSTKVPQKDPNQLWTKQALSDEASGKSPKIFGSGIRGHFSFWWCNQPEIRFGKELLCRL